MADHKPLHQSLHEMKRSTQARDELLADLLGNEELSEATRRAVEVDLRSANERDRKRDLEWP